MAASCLQVDDYLKIWATVKNLPRLECLFIDKKGGESVPDNSLWTSDSTSKIAALKKLMKKRKHRVVLDPDH